MLKEPYTVPGNPFTFRSGQDFVGKARFVSITQTGLGQFNLKLKVLKGGLENVSNEYTKEVLPREIFRYFIQCTILKSSEYTGSMYWELRQPESPDGCYSIVVQTSASEPMQKEVIWR